MMLAFLYVTSHNHVKRSKARLWLGIAFAVRRVDICQTEVVKWHDAGVCRCAYPRRDGQAELTWVAGYIPR